MQFQSRHAPHLMIIFITMIGTIYFLHKQDQLNLKNSASIGTIRPEARVQANQKIKKEKCKDREDGYRCFTNKRRKNERVSK